VITRRVDFVTSGFAALLPTYACCRPGSLVLDGGGKSDVGSQEALIPPTRSEGYQAERSARRNDEGR